MADISQPIFIVGSPRSGTSILTWCLGQHPNILPLEETNWFSKLALDLEAAYDLGASRGPRSQLSAMGITRQDFFETFGNATNELVLKHRQRYETMVHCEAGQSSGQASNGFRISRSPDEPKKRWVDGTPEYSFYIQALFSLFPNAKFIHLLRDVESVVNSLMNFSRVGGTDFTEDAAYRKWLRTVRSCVQAEQTYGPQTIFRMRYHDLVTSSDETLRRCLDFLNEPFCEACLDPLETRINSSNVGNAERVHDPETDPRLIEDAESLSRELLADPCTSDGETDKSVASFSVPWDPQLGPKRIRHIVHSSLPENCTVIVASKGDDDLLRFDGRTGWHFPQTDDGAYAGYYPANGAEAIAQIEQLRERGGQYLLFPGFALWWLDYYEELGRHLEARYDPVVHLKGECIVFDLRCKGKTQI